VSYNKWAFVVSTILILLGAVLHLQSRDCPKTTKACFKTTKVNSFKPYFCVHMLDKTRLRNYACVIEGKSFGCNPEKKTINEAIFRVCGYE